MQKMSNTTEWTVNKRKGEGGGRKICLQSKVNKSGKMQKGGKERRIARGRANIT